MQARTEAKKIVLFLQAAVEEQIDTSLWGELESESEEEESEEEEEEDEEEDGEEKKEDESGMQTPALDPVGAATPSGMSSVGMGMGGETPELLELRKVGLAHSRVSFDFVI